MRKLLTGLVAAAAFAVPVSASAAVNVDNIVLKGTAPYQAGSTINADVYVTKDNTNDVESFSYRYTNGNGIDNTWRCFNVSPNQTQASPVGGWIVQMDLVAPQSGGLFTLDVSSHGTDGDGEDNQCLTSADDTTTFSNRVEVTGSISSTSGTTGGSTGGTGSTGGATTSVTIAALQAQLDALKNLFAGLQTIVAGMAPDAICAQKPADTHSLQLFFVGQNLMTSAEVATGPGIFGPKTTRANDAFNLMHKCRA